MRTVTRLGILCLTLLPLAGRAGQPAGPPEEPRQEQRARPDDEAYRRLAERHGVSADELRRLEREEGMSWNEIGHALAVSERAKRPLEEILELRRSGADWREISRKYEVDHSQIRRGARDFEREARREGLGRHERMDRGDRRHERDRDMRRDHDRMMEHDRDMRHDRSGEQRRDRIDR